MIDVRLLRPLAKAIGARREIKRHLDCLTRQIAARAGRQATTVKDRSRVRRRSFTASTVGSSSIALPSSAGSNSTRSPAGWRCRSRSSANSSITTVSLRSIRPLRQTQANELAIVLPGFEVVGMGGLAMSVAYLGTDIGPVPDCPSCSLRSEPAAGCFKAAVAPRGGRSSLSARRQARGLLRPRPAGPQPCPARSAGSDL